MTQSPWRGSLDLNSIQMGARPTMAFAAAAASPGLASAFSQPRPATDGNGAVSGWAAAARKSLMGPKLTPSPLPVPISGGRAPAAAAAAASSSSGALVNSTPTSIVPQQHLDKGLQAPAAPAAASSSTPQPASNSDAPASAPPADADIPSSIEDAVSILIRDLKPMTGWEQTGILLRKLACALRKIQSYLDTGKSPYPALTHSAKNALEDVRDMVKSLKGTLYNKSFQPNGFLKVKNGIVDTLNQAFPPNSKIDGTIEYSAALNIQIANGALSRMMPVKSLHCKSVEEAFKSQGVSFIWPLHVMIRDFLKSAKIFAKDYDQSGLSQSWRIETITPTIASGDAKMDHIGDFLPLPSDQKRPRIDWTVACIPSRRDQLFKPKKKADALKLSEYMDLFYEDRFDEDDETAKDDNPICEKGAVTPKSRGKRGGRKARPTLTARPVPLAAAATAVIKPPTKPLNRTVSAAGLKTDENCPSSSLSSSEDENPLEAMEVKGGNGFNPSLATDSVLTTTDSPKIKRTILRPAAAAASAPPAAPPAHSPSLANIRPIPTPSDAILHPKRSAPPPLPSPLDVTLNDSSATQLSLVDESSPHMIGAKRQRDQPVPSEAEQPSKRQKMAVEYEVDCYAADARQRLRNLQSVLEKENESMAAANRLVEEEKAALKALEQEVAKATAQHARACREELERMEAEIAETTRIKKQLQEEQLSISAKNEAAKQTLAMLRNEMKAFKRMPAAAAAVCS